MYGILKYFDALVRNNTGVSSKNFFLVTVTLMGCALLAIVGFILIWEIIANGTIKTDLMGLSAFVGAITSLFAAVGLTKSIGDKNEKANNNEKSSSGVAK